MTDATSVPSKEPLLGRSFAPADARLALTATRFAGFDHSTVTLARLINFVAKGLSNNANRVLKAHGLNYTGYTVLVTLYGSPDNTLTPSQLTEASHEKAANITRICDDLLKRGLIERAMDAVDRRKVQVQLSATGKALITTVLPDMVAVTQGSFALLDAAERAQLNTLLRCVIEGQERLS